MLRWPLRHEAKVLADRKWWFRFPQSKGFISWLWSAAFYYLIIDSYNINTNLNPFLVLNVGTFSKEDLHSEWFQSLGKCVESCTESGSSVSRDISSVFWFLQKSISMLKNIIDLNLKIQLIKLSFSMLKPTPMTTFVDRPAHSAVSMNSSLCACLCVFACMCVCLCAWIFYYTWLIWQ